MTESSRPRSTEMVALAVLTGFALIAGIALGVWSLLIDQSGEPLLQAGLVWWASLMLVVGAIAGVGMTVLSGVRNLLARR